MYIFYVYFIFIFSERTAWAVDRLARRRRKRCVGDGSTLSATAAAVWLSDWLLGFPRFPPPCVLEGAQIAEIIRRDKAYAHSTSAARCLAIKYPVLEAEVVFAVEQVRPVTTHRMTPAFRVEGGGHRKRESRAANLGVQSVEIPRWNP